jgi:hypothetical protein
VATASLVLPQEETLWPDDLKDAPDFREGRLEVLAQQPLVQADPATRTTTSAT